MSVKAPNQYQTRNFVKCPIFVSPKDLPQNQLPTYLDVMRAYLQANQILKEERKNTKLPIGDVAAEIARKVQDVWVKGGIPTVSHTRIVQKFLTYHKSKYLSLMKNIKSRGKDAKF